MTPMRWDTYFLVLAENVKLRSSCVRRQVGAVIVNDNCLLTTGYNGTPRGIPNCNEGGCPRCNSKTPSGTGLDECLCVHAEINAIAQAARYGIRIEGSTLYCTLYPCKDCAKTMINAGIVRVVVGSADYNEKVKAQAEQLLNDAGIEVQIGDTPEPMLFGPGKSGGKRSRSVSADEFKEVWAGLLEVTRK